MWLTVALAAWNYWMKWQIVEHIIIIDAVLANKQPGEIIVLHDEQVPVFFSRKISPHQLGICDVLSALKLTDEFPKNLCLIGIQPKTFEPQIALSETIQKQFPEILKNIRKRFERVWISHSNVDEK